MLLRFWTFPRGLGPVTSKISFTQLCFPGTATKASCPRQRCTRAGAAVCRIPPAHAPWPPQSAKKSLGMALGRGGTAAIPASSALLEFPGISWNWSLDLLTCTASFARPVAAFIFNFIFGSRTHLCVSPWVPSASQGTFWGCHRASPALLGMLLLCGCDILPFLWAFVPARGPDKVFWLFFYSAHLHKSSGCRCFSRGCCNEWRWKIIGDYLVLSQSTGNLPGDLEGGG